MSGSGGLRYVFWSALFGLDGHGFRLKLENERGPPPVRDPSQPGSRRRNTPPP